MVVALVGLAVAGAGLAATALGLTGPELTGPELTGPGREEQAVLGPGVAGAAAVSADGTPPPPAATAGPAPAAGTSTASTASPPQPAAPPESTAATDGVRLLVPAVGLDLAVLPLTPPGSVIDPPTAGEAYWIEPYGDPVARPEQADNTLYIAAHSRPAGGAAFDPLLDGAGERGAVAVGDAVQVRTPDGTAEYTVRSTRRYAKGELPAADEVWEVAPGRLVLITCVQRDDGAASTENFVVVASA